MLKFSRILVTVLLLCCVIFIVGFTTYSPPGKIPVISSDYTITKQYRDGMTFYMVSRSNVPNFQLYVKDDK